MQHTLDIFLTYTIQGAITTDYTCSLFHVHASKIRFLMATQKLVPMGAGARDAPSESGTKGQWTCEYGAKHAGSTIDGRS